MHLACVSGNIDVVKLLAEYNADFTVPFQREKGCLQLAEENWDPLAQWLTTNMRGLSRTHAAGVFKEDRGYGQPYRSMTQCNKPTKGHEAQQDWEVLGYEPHGDGD